MKKHLIMLQLAFPLLLSAEQPVAQSITQLAEQPQIIYVPVPVTSPQEEDPDDELDRNLFLTFLVIAGTFGKILLDPSNTVSVIEGVTAIIDSILYVADIATRSTTRSPLKKADRQKFIETLAKYIQEQAQLLKEVQEVKIE